MGSMGTHGKCFKYTKQAFLFKEAYKYSDVFKVETCIDNSIFETKMSIYVLAWEWAFCIVQQNVEEDAMFLESMNSQKLYI